MKRILLFIINILGTFYSPCDGEERGMMQVEEWTGGTFDPKFSQLHEDEERRMMQVGEWTPLGDLPGDVETGKWKNTALSRDGRTVAFSNWEANTVKVYRQNHSTMIWEQLGNDLVSVGEEFGRGLSLSNNGLAVAIGGNRHSTYRGRVRVYEFSSGSWSQRGIDNEMIGENAWDRFGFAASISGDGNVVAAGGYQNDGFGYHSGFVKIYEFLNGSWNKRGNSIYGENEIDRSGYSVSICSDGSTVAIGAFSNDGNGVDSGHVRIYEFLNNIWKKKGQDIDGEAADDRSGMSVSLSSEGTVIAIGAPGNNGNVRVLEFSSGSWHKMGNNIDGGYRVSLSDDGSIVAIGAFEGGVVKVYQLLNNSWNQIGNNSNMSGNGLSLSGDGNIISIGGEDGAKIFVFEPSSPTPNPTTFITPWMVGPTTHSVNTGNNNLDGSLFLTNRIGSSVNISNVAVQLFDFNCQNEKNNTNSTSAVTISSIDTSHNQSCDYSVNIDQSNFGDDKGEFVVSTGSSKYDVKFCTRVSTWEGSIQVAFRETNFALSYDLRNNTFSLTNTQIQENNPDSFIADADSDFSVLVYQCNNYVEITTPTALQQDENLVICLEPTHGGSMAHVVHISNFNIKVYAGSDIANNYVEYNPVWFSTGGWNSNSLTDVKKKSESDNEIMISTPVIAQFFVQGHTTIKLSGNCFLEFNSVKEVRAPLITAYDMEFSVTMNVEEGCFEGLMRKIKTFF